MIGDKLGGLDRLYIAPDGPLYLVPFGALLDADGHRLAERLNVRVLETGRDLLRPVPDNLAKGLVAFGGIDFGPLPIDAPHAQITAVNSSPNTVVLAQPVAEAIAQQRAADRLRSGFGPLDASKGEIESIGAEYRVYRQDEPVELWTGLDAGETHLKALPRPPCVLHLATHASTGLPRERKTGPCCWPAWR